MKNQVLNIEVINVDKKVSAKSGAEYYLVTYYVDLGNPYPDKVTDFSFNSVPLGKQKLGVSLISDRNSNLALEKTFGVQ